MKATHRIKDKIEQKAKLDKTRDINLNEVKRVDQRIQKHNVELGDLQERLC